MKHDNTLQYKIENLTERQILIGYRVLLSVSSLIGDTLILVGSLRYNAIKLHEIIVIFVQHMAVADLLLTVFGIIPSAVFLAANDWILGDAMCYLNNLAEVISLLILFMMTAAIAVAKMLIIKYPLSAMYFSTKAGHIIAICIWIIGFSFPTATLSKDKEGVYYDFLAYSCVYVLDKHVWDTTSHKIFNTVFGIAFLVPVAGTVISSAVLLILAKRATVGHPEGLQWKGVLTVLITAASHTLLGLPITIYYVAPGFNTTHPYDMRYILWISQLAVIVNFSVISLTVPSFKKFLKKCFSCSSRSSKDERRGLLSVQSMITFVSSEGQDE